MTQSKDKKAERKIWLRFFGIAGGLVLLLTGYISLFVLQSSIKIENGLGAEAAAISYTVSLLFSLLLTPMFLRLVGVRKATILSEFCYIFYVACNFYPKRWLMMIASIVVGVAEAVLWIPIGMIPGYFGREFQQESKSAGLAGILFALLCLNQVIGNIFSFVVLHIFKDGKDNITIAVSNLTQGNSLQYCGANDCQNPNQTSQNIEQYVPENEASIYVILALFIFIMTCGVTIHWFLFPDITLEFKGQRMTSTEGTPMMSQEDKAEPSIIKSYVDTGLRSLIDTAHQLINRKQLLITPLNIFCGMFNGFFVSDVTRAFVSCVVGVQQVGISMLMFSCVTSIVCYVNGKIVERFGRLYSIIFAFITTFTLLIVFLLWQPTESTSYVVYVTFALVGIPNGCWSIILQSSYSDAFYKNKEVSFNVWNVTFTAGFALQFAISALLCVRDKIYVLIALLCVGSICIGWLEVKSGRRRSPRHDSTTSL